MPQTNSPSGLIVPVDLVAFCVNEKDAHDATPHFAGANTVFTNQLEKYPAFLGANINRDFTQSPWQPMEAGIHLHWALPDGLTKAKTSTGSLVFYPAPNRWLVSRFLLHKDGKIERRSWVVLSDKLNDRLPQGQKSITLPLHPTKTPNYQYCGEWQIFDSSWQEPVIAKDRLFVEQTGLELSAVSSGQVSFASFYPNCRGVFGFVDLLKDIKLPSGGQVELMYQVTGWFSNSNNDPIKATPTLTDIQQKYGWTFKQEPGDKAPDYSLYYGIVQRVIWHLNEIYLEPCSPNLPEVKLDLSIGNNPAETLSAFLKEQNHPDIPYFETLLNAYFQGLLNALQNPAPDQLATMEETLQEREFSTIEAEYLYFVVKKTIVDGAEQFIEVVDLPPGLGDALNRLNQCAQRYQRLQASVANQQWQLFADWYRIFLANQQSQQASYDIAYKKYNKLNDDVQTLLSAAKEALDKQQQAVVSQLPTGCELRQAPAPRYWQPAEPVILLSGDALPPMERYGGDGRFNPDGNLVCRLTDRLLSAVTANGVTVTSANFEGQNIPVPNGLPAPDIFNRLLREACLLNTTLLKNITKQDMENVLLGKDKPLITFEGLPPSPVGVNWWNGNPWLPLFAAWTVKFQPLFATTDTNHTQLFDYPADFFTRRFHIDIDDGAYVEYQPESIPDPKKFEQTYKGSAVLTTSPITGIIRQLEKSGDDASKDLLKELKKPMLMQSISGINAAFLMHQQDVQLNIGVPPGTDYDDFTNAIADAVGVAGQTAPDFNGYFNPIRTGFFTLDLILIDVFGQKKHVNSTRVNIAQSMTTFYKKKDNKQAAPGIVYLQPRLASPARLLLRWIAADSGGLDEMNPHPATTPICGWLLPNHVDGSLFFYNAQGASLGTLFLNGDKTEIRWQSAPGRDATIDQPIETVMEDENPYLKKLALALKDGTPEFFKAFARAIDQVNASVNPPSDDSSNALSVLVGRPLALAQVSLGLELRGGPPYNQSWKVLDLDEKRYPYKETDNGFTEVQFPIVLGNLTKLNDGLIGYFKQNGDQSAYNLSTFYTSGAPSKSRTGVIRPQQNDLLLTPYPPANLPVDDEKTYTRKVLTLLDPRAALHASTGILPTKSITIPPYMYTDTLRLLEMTFMCLPVLRGQSALHLPLPLESGYEWSWVQEQKVNGTPEWVVTLDVASPAPIGLWTYTPQTLIEGWLRLNPKLLPDQPDQ